MPAKSRKHDRARPDLSSSDNKEVEERLRLRAPIVYRIISEEGEEELERPLWSLWWSGLAAGFGISFSVVSEALLHRDLPDEPWRPLVENFGYSVGFLIVVLGRLQLFTENTITAVLPGLAQPSWLRLARMGRLWGIVFCANMAGTFLFAAISVWTNVVTVELIVPMSEMARNFVDRTTVEMMLHGILAGFLIAAMVWMLPSAQGAEFWVVVVITYIIALGDFTHVIAGSTEVFILLVRGELSVAESLFAFVIPSLIGNIIGGTALFAMLAYAQVKQEI